MRKLLFVTYGGTHYKIMNVLHKNFNCRFLMHKKFQKAFEKHFDHSKGLNINFSDSKLDLFLRTRKEYKDYEVIVSHCPISGSISYFSTLFTKKKRVFLMCQDFYEYFDVSEKNPLKRFFYGNLIKFLIKLSCKNSLVIALSQHIKRRAIHYGAKNVVIIPVYGVDMKIFKPQKRPIIFDTEKKILLSTARLSPEKGLPYLLKAITELDNILLVMAGGGKDKQLQKIIKELNIEDKIKIIGEVDPIEISNYYNSCDIFVLPSLKEGLGFATAEAMACKKPVIASDTGGIPDIVIHNKTGILVTPRNVEQLKSSIQKLINNPEFGKQLAETGYLHVKNNYKEEDVMKKFVETLTSL